MIGEITLSLDNLNLFCYNIIGESVWLALERNFMYSTNNITYWDIETSKDVIEVLKSITHETENLSFIKQINRIIEVFKNNSDYFKIFPSLIEYSGEDNRVEMKFFFENIPSNYLFKQIEVTIYDDDIAIAEQKVYSINPRDENGKKDKENEDYYYKMMNSLKEFLINPASM